MASNAPATPTRRSALQEFSSERFFIHSVPFGVVCIRSDAAAVPKCWESLNRFRCNTARRPEWQICALQLDYHYFGVKARRNLFVSGSSTGPNTRFDLYSVLIKISYHSMPSQTDTYTSEIATRLRSFEKTVLNRAIFSIQFFAKYMLNIIYNHMWILLLITCCTPGRPRNCIN